MKQTQKVDLNDKSSSIQVPQQGKIFQENHGSAASGPDVERVPSGVSVASNRSAHQELMDKKLRQVEKSFCELTASVRDEQEHESAHFENWKMEQRQGSWYSLMDVICYFFGYHPRSKKGASKLLHPIAPFCLFANGLSSLCELYFFCTIPVLISFFWGRPACWRHATLEVDMFCEIVFVFEIFIQFFIGFYDKQGIYQDSFSKVVKNYLQGMFLFDVCTSTPISWLEFFLVHNSQECITSSLTSDHPISYARVPIRLIRPLRLLKVVRLLRVLRIFSAIDHQLQAPNPVVHIDLWMQKALFLGVTVTFVEHVYCCAFWLIKEVFSDDMDGFLAINDLGRDDIVGQYVLAGYFVNTVFTTIGFGDIRGENTAERLFIVLVEWTGAICFATVVSEMQDMVHQFNRRTHGRKERMQFVRAFLTENHCSHDLKREILEWVHFSFMKQHDKADQIGILDSLPQDLQERLALHLNKGMLGEIPQFSSLNTPARGEFLASLALEAGWRLCRDGEEVLVMSATTDRIYMITSGNVQMLSEEGSPLATLSSGDFFGYLSPEGASWQGECIVFVAQGPCELSFISHESLKKALADAPHEIHTALIDPLFDTGAQALNQNGRLNEKTAAGNRNSDDRSGTLPLGGALFATNSLAASAALRAPPGSTVTPAKVSSSAARIDDTDGSSPHLLASVCFSGAAFNPERPFQVETAVSTPNEEHRGEWSDFAATPRAESLEPMLEASAEAPCPIVSQI